MQRRVIKPSQAQGRQIVWRFGFWLLLLFGVGAAVILLAPTHGVTTIGVLTILSVLAYFGLLCRISWLFPIRGGMKFDALLLLSVAQLLLFHGGLIALQIWVQTQRFSLSIEPAPLIFGILVLFGFELAMLSIGIVASALLQMAFGYFREFTQAEQCPRCGYDPRGNVSDVCPECGAACGESRAAGGETGACG